MYVEDVELPTKIKGVKWTLCLFSSGFNWGLRDGEEVYSRVSTPRSTVVWGFI